MKNFIKAICLICCLSLVLTVCAACGGNKNQTEIQKVPYLIGTTSNIALSDSVENDAWKLEFDPETANVMVTDKKTGDIYSQIPYACATKTLCQNQTLRFTVYQNQNQTSDIMPESPWLQTVSFQTEGHGNSTNA